MSEWISVKERLPECGKEVLIYWRNTSTRRRRISSMSKKVNPRRQPASKADVKRAELRGRDDGIKFASALFLMVLRDKEGFDLEALQKVWKEVGDLADSIAEGYCSIEDLHTVLESEAGARIVGGIAT